MDCSEGTPAAGHDRLVGREIGTEVAPAALAAVDREVSPPSESSLRDDPTIDPASPAEDVCWEPEGSLPPAQPAPKTQSRNGPGVRADELSQLVVGAIVLLAFERRGRSFSVRELWGRVPAPKPEYVRLNAVGDVLGQGGGKHGLKLWKGAGGLLGCRENAVIALRRMAPDAVRGLAQRLGFTDSAAFWAAVNALPAAGQCVDR
jgi:hypothetical protein